MPYAYNITFFGSVAILSKILGSDKLKDLANELSIYDHDWTYDNILDGLETGLTVGSDTSSIIYPLISPERRFIYDSDTGYTPQDNISNIALSTDGIRPADLKPAIRVIRIIEAIEAKYPQIKFSRDFFSEDIFNELYLWLHRNAGGILSATGKSERIISNWVQQTENISCGDYYAYFSDDYFETTTGGDTSFGTDTIAELSVTPVDSATEYTFKIVDLITDTVLAERTGKGVLGYTIDIGEWFETPQFWRIQVQISTEDSITLNTYSARWQITTQYYVDSALDCTNYQDYRVTDQAMLSRIIAANQMPDIKILDFLTGIFKMFNLTSYIEDTEIIVEDLDTFYSDYETWDITEFVGSENIDVNRVPLYSEVNFEYKEPKTFLSKEFSETNGANFGEDKYIITSLDEEFIDGGEYKVQLPFEKVIYERLNDEDDGVLTNAQYGYFVNDKQEKELGSPLLFLNVNQEAGTKPIYFVSTDGVTSNSLTTYNRPSNVASDNVQTINFSAEIDEWLRDTNENSLFKNYYETYIANVFNKRNRLTSVTAYLPINILTKYNLSDRFKIGDQEYRINTIQTELTSGKSNLELLSIITDEFQPPILTCPTADNDEVRVDSTLFTVDCGDALCATADETNVTVDNDSLTVDCGDPIPTTTTTTSTTSTTLPTTTTTAGTTTTTTAGTTTTTEPTTTTTTEGTTTTTTEGTTTTTETPCIQRIAYSPIPTQSIEVGSNIIINLNNYFTQLDGQPLYYLANDISEYVESVSIAGSQLTINANSSNLCGTDSTGVIVEVGDGIEGNCEYGAFISVEVFGCTTTTLPTTTTTSTSTTTEPTTTTTEPTTTTTSTSTTTSTTEPTTTVPTTSTTSTSTTSTTTSTTTEGTTTEPTTTTTSTSTTSTSTTSTSTTSTTTTTLFESYPYEISVLSSSANACYEELVETVYTDVPTLAGIQDGTIFWTDEARTTLKDGGFYAYGLGNVADVYGSKSCRISTSGVVSQLANCVTTTTTEPTTTTTSTTTTTTAAPTTPIGTINNTYVGYSGTAAGFDVYTEDAVTTYIDFIIYPTDGGSYSERQLVPTVNGTVVNWLISWKDDVDTSNGGTGVANLVVTNNYGTESTLDSDSFVIPTSTPTTTTTSTSTSTTTTTTSGTTPQQYIMTAGLIFQGGSYQVIGYQDPSIGTINNNQWIDTAWSVYEIDTSTTGFGGTTITVRRLTNSFTPQNFNNIELISPSQGTINMSFAQASVSITDNGGYRYVEYFFPYNWSFNTGETITINVT